MRRSYLVCYDIRHPKRLRHTHKLMKAYGKPWQYSVFYCTLKDIDRVRLENELREILNLKEDQVLIVDLGAQDDGHQRTTFVGVNIPTQDEGTVVI